MSTLANHFDCVQAQRIAALRNAARREVARAGVLPGGDEGRMAEEAAVGEQVALKNVSRDSIIADLLAFLAERLKVQLRAQGKRHDLVDAVFAPNANTGAVDDDLVRIVARVDALDAFLKTEDGANLLAGYKRAANIVRAEEKKESSKNGDLSTLPLLRDYPQERLFSHDAERALYAALTDAQARAKAAVAQENFTAAMEALARLRAPVDQFFEDVLVNAPENEVRLNRLALLTRMRAALHEVADFSKIES